jgi:hypothetical protein
VSADRPTDEHCQDHEYITELNGVWFIVGIRGEYRLHPDELPEQLRTPPTSTRHRQQLAKRIAAAVGVAWLVGIPIASGTEFLSPGLYIAATVAGVLAGGWLPMVAFLMWASPDGTPEYRDWNEQRRLFLEATYRDCGIHQPTIWLDTTSHYMESPSATWGI